MQQEPSQKSFTPQAPSVNPLNRDSRANPAAAQAQHPQAPPTRPAGPAPVHVASHQARVAPQHLAYPEPALQYNHAHQGRRAQAPGHAGYFTGYSNVTATPGLNHYAQSYMNPANNFAMAAQYNNYAPYRGPTHVPQPAIGAAQAIQGREFQSPAVPPTHRVSTALHPPPRKSKAIPIVNPDTNEIVKISKAKETTPIPKVSPPVRKPLEVVRPSEKAEETQPVPAKPALEKPSIPASEVVKSEPPAMKTEVTVSPENVAAVAKTAQDVVKGTVPAEVTAEDTVKPVEKTSATAPSDKELAVSDVTVTENKMEPSDKSTGSIPSDVDISKTATDDARPSEDEIAIEVVDKKEEPVVQQDANKPSTETVPVEPKSKTIDSGDVPNKEENVSDKVVSKDEKVEPASENANATPPVAAKTPPVSTPSSPPKRVRPTSPTWTEGSRRVYNLEFLMEMRYFTESSRVDYYDSILAKHKVSRNQPSGRPDGGRQLRRDGSNRSKVGPTDYMGPRAGAYGAPPDFDIGSARNSRPPAGTRRSSNYDPRGTRNQDGGRRQAGPMRGGVGPLDQVQDQGPVEKLKKSENHWSRKKEDDTELQAKVKTVRSLLNKLTIEKFDKITNQILEVEISTPDEAQSIVAEVFEKTLFEPKFAGMYALLCKRLDSATRAMFEKTMLLDKHGKQMTFRKVLVKLCQIEFEKASDAVGASSGKDDPKEEEGEDEKKPTVTPEEEEKAKKPTGTPEEQEKAKKQAEADAELKRAKAKRRTLGNIRFIGELFLVDLISEGIIHKHCIQPLLSQGIKTKEEEILEAFTNLMKGVGKKVSQSKDGSKLVNEYFKRITDLSKDYALPARCRFFLQDLIDQRKNDWKPRREDEVAKTIAEIHADIEKETRAKQAKQEANRSRSGRGSAGGSRDRRGGGYTPSMQMVMGKARANPPPSRSSAVLERVSSRPRNFTSSVPNVRLGPSRTANAWNTAGGSGSRIRSGMNAGASSQSLRPQTSSGRFGALEHLMPESGSADTRRAARAPAAPPASKEPELKSDEEVRKKARSLMTEYWESFDEKELKECVAEEVGSANGVKFIEFSVREALNAKISVRDKGVPYFKLLVNEKLFPVQSIITAFTTIVAELDNITVDDPRAAEFVARYLAALYTTGKLGADGKTGLEFLNSALSHAMGKIPVKFMLALLSEITKMLKEEGEEEESIKKKVLEVFKAGNIDMTVSILTFNSMRGISILEDMLKEYSLEYLVPSMKTDKKLISDILQDATGQTMLDNLKALDENLDMKCSEFAAKVVTCALAIYLYDGSEKISEKMTAGAGALLKLVHNGESPPSDTQMSVLLAIQPILYELSKNPFPPPLHDDYVNQKLTHGYVAFDALYESEVVEEDTFMKWKADDSEKVMKVGGKPEVLLMTASWFTWLATAETA